MPYVNSHIENNQKRNVSKVNNERYLSQFTNVKTLHGWASKLGYFSFNSGVDLVATNSDVGTPALKNFRKLNANECNT